MIVYIKKIKLLEGMVGDEKKPAKAEITLVTSESFDVGKFTLGGADLQQ